MLDCCPGVESPQTAYIPPGPFSHPLGGGDTARAFCLLALVHSPSDLPKRDKRINLETSLHLWKYKVSSRCLSDDRKIRVTDHFQSWWKKWKDSLSQQGVRPRTQHTTTPRRWCITEAGKEQACRRHPGGFFRSNWRKSSDSVAKS